MGRRILGLEQLALEVGGWTLGAEALSRCKMGAGSLGAPGAGTSVGRGTLALIDGAFCPSP